MINVHFIKNSVQNKKQMSNKRKDTATYSVSVWCLLTKCLHVFS